MANKYRGEVEFEDSTGQKFVLRLGVNQFIDAQKEIDVLEGRAYQRALFHLALIHGAESQKDMTVEDVGELLDDIGFVEFNRLYGKTKFGSNVEQANQFDKRNRDVAMTIAVSSVVERVEKIRETTKDVDQKALLGRVVAVVTSMLPKAEGSANPPEATTPSN